ncbi:MAG: hypothetical protein AMJ53_18655 [Gammaproteobacteria bacterium SG8_11]|nr:MAG: hypothetical protein AMJ53_18655 [Gammaproteobacteria bacterium SG8_11]
MIRIVTLSNKPDYLQDCLEYVRCQDRPAEHYVITDNCVDWGDRFPPSAWLNDQWERAAADDYVCWLSDDDYMMPEFTARLAGYLDEHPEYMAVYGNARHVLYERGRGIVKFIRFLGEGVYSSTRLPMGQIDGAQMMIRRSALDVIERPWQPEELDHARVCDGILLNKIAVRHGIYPIGGDPVIEFRTTPDSAHTYMDGDTYRKRDWRHVAA